MELNREQFEQHLQAILCSRRIKGKIVVLCEGHDVAPQDVGKPRSPQTYRKQEKMPDANFYLACIPRNWRNRKLPCFFNCGGRSQVISTFAGLLELHQSNPAGSYLEPKKLFAIVDLDVQSDTLPNGYRWTTTEDVYQELYESGSIKHPVDCGHKIWVTALVHKEAFFLLPSVKEVFSKYHNQPYVDGNPMRLKELHMIAAKKIDPEVEGSDRDLELNFDVVKKRLENFNNIPLFDCDTPTTLSNSWIEEAKKANSVVYEQLVRALFTVTKAKPLWKMIGPDPTSGWTRGESNYRDQLALLIGKNISEKAPDDHPITGFMEWLKKRR